MIMVKRHVMLATNLSKMLELSNFTETAIRENLNTSVQSVAKHLIVSQKLTVSC